MEPADPSKIPIHDAAGMPLGPMVSDVAGEPPGRLSIKRLRGEAIDIAIAAGVEVRVQVMEIDEGQVRLLLIAPKQVRFKTLTRQEAGKYGRRRA